ncbi:MAG: c-type cytochrome [Verrucomicrobia bacterium]|nr:c-type cytochrome [Verrucomicrobiota bacterium]
MGHIGVRGWPGDLSGSVLVCDAVSHIVHRDVILEQGSGFVATRSPSEQQSEFIASRDTACRPVGLELGPDSALYLIDMQRDVIEHPDYIPEKVKERMNLRAGENRGRIYRIAPKGQSKQRVMLAGLSDTERVSLLGHSNQWVRVTAQRLLVESGRTQIAAQLRERLRDQANPLGQLHALWTLQGLELLTWEDLDKLLGSNEPGLVENALVASETKELWRSEAVSRARELCASSHPRVRFQAVLTLGVLSDARDVDRLAALRNVWMRDWQYPLSRVAVIIGLPDRANTLLADFLKAHRAPSTNSALRDAMKDLGFSTGRQRTAESDRSLAEVLREASKPGFPAELARTVLESIHSGLSSQPPQATAEEASILEAMEKSLSETSRPALWRLCNKLKLPTSSIQKATIAEAIRRAADRTLATSLRVEAMDVLRLGDGVSTRPVLFGLMDSREPARLQSVAWEQLKSSSEEAVAQEILARWKGISPSLRPSIVNSLVYRKSWNGSLLQSLEEGRLTAGELNLDLEQRRQLLRHAGETNKVRASKFFGDEEYSNRKTVVSDWLARLPSKGDGSKGRVVFEKLCASCHQSNGKGHAVGPDLTRQSHRSVEDLASNILDPNMALNPSFAAVTVEQKDGETVVGILESEDSEQVVLKQAQGIKVNVSRAEISGLTYTSRSLMPEGLESGLSPQELRDLIAYIQE